LLEQKFTGHQVVLNCCLVLAHQVEQSAHLPLGLLRLPAYLKGAEGSTRACALTRAW
jgi:hypothetical protein